MLTPATRAVARITNATTDDGRAIVVTIGPGDVLTFRAKGRRTEHTVSVASAFAHAARFAARDAKRARRHKRRASAEKTPGTRSTVTAIAHPVTATPPALPDRPPSVPPRVRTSPPRAKLYAIHVDVKSHLWCGFASIAAATGLPVSTIKQTACTVLQRERVTGMWSGEVVKVLRALGYDSRATYYGKGSRPTFKAFRTGRDERARASLLIVGLTGHFVTLLGNRLVDNRHCDPIMCTDYRHQRTRVESYVEVMGKLPTNGA